MTAPNTDVRVAHRDAPVNTQSDCVNDACILKTLSSQANAVQDHGALRAFLHEPPY
jgi:hypothetical protein